jgi:hypothetical protein
MLKSFRMFPRAAVSMRELQRNVQFSVMGEGYIRHREQPVDDPRYVCLRRNAI